MILVHLLIAIATLFAAFFQRIDFLGVYLIGVDVIQGLPWSVYAWVVVGSCVLVLLSVILEYMKAYSFMYILSRGVLEVSLLALSLITFWSIFFGWWHLKNLWFDMIPLVFIPYLGLFVALLMFQLFDFNYPSKRRVVVSVFLSFVSISLVFLHML